MDRRKAVGVLAVMLIVSISFFFISSKFTGTESEAGDSNLNEAFIFQNLPEKADKFDLTYRNFYEGQIDDYTLINEGMWMRPEFYPTWERSGIPTFTKHDYDRWGVHGFGFFPCDQAYNIVNMKAGNEFTFYSWFHTSWGVQTWQGVQFQPVSDSNYFDVKITPNLFMTGPTYPIFDGEWTRLVKMTVVAKEDIPQGQYIISVAVKSPSYQQGNEWAWELLDEYTEGDLHSEIERCKHDPKNTNCEYLIEQRQAKYVQGGFFSPTNLFRSELNVVVE